MARDKTEIVRKLVPVFRQYGYEGSTLSRISAASGLGRASLYHHFPGGKQDMAQAVLEYVDTWFAETVLAPLAETRGPLQRLQGMSESLAQFYNQGQDACLLAIFSLGEGRDLFQEQVRAALRTWIAQLAQVLREAGESEAQAQQRAEDAVMQIQGALVLTRGLDQNDLFERVLQQLPEQLLGADSIS